MTINKLKLAALVAITASSFMYAPVFASDDARRYEVTITNLTRGISFTPILVATHRSGPVLFTVGQPASNELLTVAESGNTAPLANSLNASGKVADLKTTTGLLAPGQSVTVVIEGGKKVKHISIASMLLPTNDAFFSLNAVRLPGSSRARSYYSPAYDAGSETNDELCINIPGPHCGGIALSPDDSGEGFVHIHAGIHGIGSLDVATYDWRNPVAKISIRRLKD